MGQPKVSKQAEDSQIKTAEQQNAIAAQTLKDSEEDRARRVTLEQPAIDKLSALSGGDKTAALKASMPVLSQISGGYDAAKQSIFNSVPAGPQRDKAIADLEIKKSTTVAGTQAAAVEEAPDKLANIGAGLGATSLQELAASLNAGTSSASIFGSVGGAADSRKAQNLQLLGGLAGTAGAVATGGIKPLPSDRRIKREIFPQHNILDRLAEVDVYDFEYVSQRYKHDGMEKYIGLMAQDVQKEFPQAVGVGSMGGQDYLKVDYAAIAAIAIGGLKELMVRVRILEDKLALQEVLNGRG